MQKNTNNNKNSNKKSKQISNINRNNLKYQ